MTTPPDEQHVIDSIRLGWAISEVRGRNRLVGPPTESRATDRWPSHALPLNDERSNAELEIEAKRLLIKLASVDPESPIQPDPPPKPPAPLWTCSEFVDSVTEQIGILARQADDPTALLKRSAKWEQLAEVLYRWDADIQDDLTINSVEQLAGYNLGRALSDVYWALDLTANDGISTSWTFLLGKDRRARVNEYLRRLSNNFDPLTPSVVSGSLTTWGTVASDLEWRQEPDTLDKLHEQLRRWYSVIVLGDSPLGYLSPFSLIRNWRATRTALSAFLPELCLLLGALGAAAAFGSLVAVDYSATWLKSLIGFLSVFGVSIAAITARLKVTTKDLVTRLKNKAYADAASIDFTTAPEQRASASPFPNSNRRSATRMIRRTSVQREMDPVS